MQRLLPHGRYSSRKEFSQDAYNGERSDGTEGPGFIWVENEPGAELRTLLKALDSNGGGEPKGETKAELDAFDFLRRNFYRKE